MLCYARQFTTIILQFIQYKAVMRFEGGETIMLETVNFSMPFQF
jgi:hypothetical protein